MNKNNKNNETNNTIIEPFDGIRKNNSRFIFGILLFIISMDIIIYCFKVYI